MVPDAYLISMILVAPRVGAWIEMHKIQRASLNGVAPRVGAWIEMAITLTGSPRGSVAPRVGAWIEIVHGDNDLIDIQSLPVWERGLKC